MRIRRRSLIAPLLTMLVASSLVISGSDDLLAGAKQKVDKIVGDKTSPGETISLSVAEVNALFQGAMKEENVQGVTNATIDFADDTGTWSGVVDFDKLPELAPYKSNFLLSSILKGSSPVSTTASLVSSAGQATFDVKQVTLGDTKFEGSTLGFLIKHVVLSDYPNIELGEPFDLEHNVDSIKLSPKGITFKIKN